MLLILMTGVTLHNPYSAGNTSIPLINIRTKLNRHLVIVKRRKFI